MNARHTLTAALTAVSLLALPGCSSTDNRSEVVDNRVQPYGLLGRVSRIDEVSTERRPSGAGAVIGGVLGAVVGNQIGSGTGRTLATVAGAVGGAVAGNEIEKSRSDAGTAYDVHVRLDGGESRVITVAELNGLTVGERVRVEGDNIVRLG